MTLTVKLSNNSNKLQKRLIRETGKAICDYNMIEDGDRIMVCISGGKDSYSLLNILLALQARAPVKFELFAMNLDQKQPGFPAKILPAYCEALGIEYKIVTEDTYSIVREKIPEGKTTCSLCSRLRRGIIYRTATEMGANKIALGHHREDIVETLFLNMFFGARLKAMPPKLKTDDGKHIVIRPLAYCAEKDIARYARAMEFPIIPCNLCGTQVNAQRQLLKRMLEQWEEEYPGRTANILKSMKTVVPSHLMDTQLHDCMGLTSTESDLNDEANELQLDDNIDDFTLIEKNIKVTLS